MNYSKTITVDDALKMKPDQIVDLAKRRLGKARTELILEQPFFGSLALNLKPVAAFDCPGGAMGTDSENLFYNPVFVLCISMSVLKTAVAHEVMHVAMMHLTRRNSRDPMIWNCAGDHAINNILKECKLSSGQSAFEVDPAWLCEDRFKGMSADEIYPKLQQEMQKQKKQSGDGEGGGDGGDQDQNGQGDQDQDGDQPQAGDGGLWTEDSGHGNKDHPGPCGGMKEPRNPDGSKMSKGQIAKKEAQFKRQVAQAASMARKQAGNLPGQLQRLIDEIVNPQVDWRNQLRRFMEHVTKNDFAWQKPNRRYIHHGMYLPTLHSLECGEVVIATDTSGSIGPSELKQFVGEMNGLLEAVDVKKIYVLYVDTRVSSVQEFEKNDLPLDVKPTGGGGTDLTVPFDWVEQQGIQPSCLIYLTDMFGPSPEYGPDYPTIWVSTTKEEDLPSQLMPKFGEFLTIHA